MIREVVLDTETTGMNPHTGDRIVEIGAVELLNHLPTGRTLQLYINPQRDVPAEATAVHGITNDFLRDKPIFSQVYSDFIDFIGTDSILVIHNAEFDMKFVNWELQNVGHSAIKWDRVIDTLAIARKKFPGSPASLDALCRRFSIDNAARTFHGALLDSELLAEVYLELLGGRQHGLALTPALEEKTAARTTSSTQPATPRPHRPARPHAASEEELNAHADMVGKMKDAIWGRG